MEKTCIEYLYRDANNFKTSNVCVIDGVLSEEQKDAIMSCLDDGEYFIPSMVGLPETKFGSETDADHPFFELTRNGFREVEVDAASKANLPEVDITPEALVTAFHKCKDNWWVPSGLVTEWCPHCENEITMGWNVIDRGYKAFCPVCGKRLMLCDMCQHRGTDGDYREDCDYGSDTDTCRFNKKEEE